MADKATDTLRFCRKTIGITSDHTTLRLSSNSLAIKGYCLFALILSPVLAQTQTPAQNQPQTPPAAPTAVPPTPQDPQALVDRPSAPVDPSTFKIGPEDVLRVHVWKEPDLTLSVVVRPDGRVSLPLVGEIEATGMTPLQLQGKLIEAYDKFLNRPQILVSVLDVRSKKYYLSGNIARTGPVPLVTPTTILQAISGAGGFREFAKQTKIIIMRGNERIKFNYKEVMKGKKTEQNIYLQDGDHIYVP